MSSSPTVLQSRLPSLPRSARSWRQWLSSAISLLLLVAIVSQLHRLGMPRLRSAVPASPLFWLALAAYYLALPASEWMIFRRLWNLPAAGFAALLRKLVSNEVLMGYSGELSFYSWARRRSELTAAPFGAIKDVSVLSALAGNIATLAMMALAWPLLSDLHVGATGRDLGISVGVVLVISVLAALFNRRIFSLPARELRFILGVHLLRLVATTALLGIMWRAALPEVPLSLWVLLAAMQLLVTRLPFVPNKDLLFAGVALFVVGHDGQVGALIALIATLILSTHLLIGGVLAIVDLFETAERR